jgi:hypothetical protein
MPFVRIVNCARSSAGNCTDRGSSSTSSESSDCSATGCAYRNSLDSSACAMAVIAVVTAVNHISQDGTLFGRVINGRLHIGFLRHDCLRH